VTDFPDLDLMKKKPYNEIGLFLDELEKLKILADRNRNDAELTLEKCKQISREIHSKIMMIRR
jgi:hypothetical protein